MARAIQKRTLETRARLMAAAEEVIAESGFEAMRVEEVVLRAGTAKGTFFAHFKDKEALMELIIGARLDTLLDDIAAAPVPRTPEEMAETLTPFLSFMTSERYVFDLSLRYSGATAIAEVGPIAMTFGRQVEVFAAWFKDDPPRTDIDAELLAEGVMAFAIQAMSTNFCALHNATSIHDRLVPYLKAWLNPSVS
ncbi:MAG: TetR/AcrR family transcriptional regulator [Pseudomonadota bacterium]